MAKRILIMNEYTGDYKDTDSIAVEKTLADKPDWRRVRARACKLLEVTDGLEDETKAELEYAIDILDMFFRCWTSETK